jgi:cell division protein FtsQ
VIRRPKANRRKAESALARFKPLTLAFRWRTVLRALVWAPLAVAALAAAVGATRAMLDRPVRKLVVEGTFQRVTPLQIEAAVESDVGGGFLSLDLGKLRHDIERLDWVDTAKVGRAWPDTLTIDVTEHRVAARWGEKGLLDVRGRLFTETAPYALPELPDLAGPEGSEREVARRYLALRGPLAEAGLKLKSLSVDERGAWQLELESGQEIRLGRRDVDQRLYRFFEVVAPALAGDFKRAKYIDLRYTNGFAVGWSDDAETTGLASKAPGDDASRGQQRG